MLSVGHMLAQLALAALALAALLRPAAAAPYPLPYRYTHPREYSHQGAFPDGFEWGLGTAAYQVEGAYAEGGRGLSIWDVFTGADGSEINPGMNDGRGDTGSVACDQYHRFREDVALMRALGLKQYRFSISWPRLLPGGTLDASGGRANPAGRAYYDSLIDALRGAGIEPVVTLYHWDLPQALLNDSAHGHPSQYAGWLDARMPALFAEYAGLCFELFGDRVKTWYTFNEAWTFTVLGMSGQHAPSLCNWDGADACRKGARAPAGTDVYLAGHHVLLAHGRAVREYRSRFAARQRGRIGMTNNIDWAEPASASEADIAAAARHNEFFLGWFADPVWLGDYPESMRAALGERLPTFTAAERALLKGSADMFGLNTYSGRLLRDAPLPSEYGTDAHPPSWGEDSATEEIILDEWPTSNSSWLFSVPWGVRKLLNWINARYAPPAIYITENGWSVGAASAGEAVCDAQRIGFFANYTSEMYKAINEDGVPLAGYTGWSLLDNFEWAEGYTQRFGLVYVDYESEERYVKASACYYKAMMASNALVDPAPFQRACAEGAPRVVSFSQLAHELELEGEHGDKHGRGKRHSRRHGRGHGGKEGTPPDVCAAVFGPSMATAAAGAAASGAAARAGKAVQESSTRQHGERERASEGAAAVVALGVAAAALLLAAVAVPPALRRLLGAREGQ